MAEAKEVKALLEQTDPKSSKRIVFHFNPEKITISHTLRMKEISGQKTEAGQDGQPGEPSQPAQPLNVDETVRQLGIQTIKIDELIFYGQNTKRRCDTLLNWSKAVAKDPTDPKNTVTVPIGLRFSWGRGLVYDVHAETVTVTYTRFAEETGLPLRAKVSLTLHQYVPGKPKHNPTSGGPPGRRTHLLDSSECLPSVATTHYGRPSAWRGIAQINGIDDPLRARPGTRLYLPNPDELANGDRP